MSKRKKGTSRVGLRRGRHSEPTPAPELGPAPARSSSSVAERAWWDRCDLAVVYGMPPDDDDLRMADALVADLPPSVDPTLASVACLLAMHFRRCVAISSWRYFDVAFFASAHLTANFDGSRGEVDEVLLGLGHFFEWLTLHGVIESRDLATLRLNVEAARNPTEMGDCVVYGNAVPPGSRSDGTAA